MNYLNITCPSPEFDDAILELDRYNNTVRSKDRLTPLDMHCMEELVRGRPRVPFTLKRLFGLHWTQIYDGKRFGQRVCHAVRKHGFPGMSPPK